MVIKLFWFLTILALLHIVREIFRFGVAFKLGKKYESSDKRTIITMVSLSYLIMILICGI